MKKNVIARACRLLLVLGVVLAAGSPALSQTGGCSIPANVLVNDGFEYNTAADVPTNLWRQDKLVDGAWTFVTSPVFGGQKSSAITIHQFDNASDSGTSERDEVQEQSNWETPELVPRERTMHYYIPASFPNTNVRLVMTQWKQREGTLPVLGPAHPALALRYRSGVMWVELEYDDNFQVVLWSTTADMRGRWFTLTYRTLFDRTGTTGYVQLWLDGVQVTNYQGITAYPTSYQYPDPSQETFYFKFGLYRNSIPDVWTAYFDDYLNCTVSADTSPDFRLTFSPNYYQTITAGSSATYTATITAQNGFTGTTNLSASSYGWPSGTTVSLNPTSVTGSGTSTVTVTTSSTTSSGSYPVSIIGTSGSLSHATAGALVVNPPSPSPDFSFSAEPAPQAAVTPGNSGSYSITATALNNFNATVNQSVSGLPAGATASFNPTSVTANSTTPGTSTLTVTTSSTTPPGTYTLTITGTSGSLTRSSLAYLIVTGTPSPDFSISASPSSQTVNQGASTTYTTTLTALNGFTGTTNLSVSGLPAGATGSFNPTSVAGSGNSTLSVSTASTTPAGTYTLTITGTSGTLSHSTSVNLVVNGPTTPNFTVSATPSSQTTISGKSVIYTVTITPHNGFTGTVNLSVLGLPTAATGSFNPTSVTGSGNSSLTVGTASFNTPAGTYPLAIRGTSGTLTNDTTVTLVVTPCSPNCN